MTAVWPNSVPYLAVQGSFQGEAPFRKPYRTTFEDGNKRARRASTKNIATVTYTLEPFTKAQFRTFAEWVRDELVDGTLPFKMKVWTGTDDNYAERTCSFAEDYGWTDFGHGMTQVQIKVDVDNFIASGGL